MPIILAPWEIEIGRIMIGDWPRQKCLQDPILIEKVECGDACLSYQLWRNYKIGGWHTSQSRQK
jgi:hypothetical protein